MTKGKHTEGDLAAHSGVLCLNDGTNRLLPIFSHYRRHKDKADARAEANATRLALCWNMHDELVEALEIGWLYAAEAVERDGGIDVCEIGLRADLERFDALLSRIREQEGAGTMGDETRNERARENGNESAFPNQIGESGTWTIGIVGEGLTKREYIATQMMAGLAANPSRDGIPWDEDATQAIAAADALLSALEQYDG